MLVGEDSDKDVIAVAKIDANRLHINDPHDATSLVPTGGSNPQRDHPLVQAGFRRARLLNDEG
jgi:hypothetical protein